MSWFFGKKKEEHKKSIAQEKAQAGALAKEKESFARAKTMEESEGTVKKLEAKIADYKNKIAQGEVAIKAHLQAKNKDKAKRELKNVKACKDQIVKIQGQLMMLEKQKNNIDNAHADDDFFNTLKEGNQVINKNQHAQEEMMEELEKAKELQNEQQMNQEMMNGMLEQSEDSDIDDEFARQEAEALGEQANQYDKQFDNNQGLSTKVNVPAQKVQQNDDVDDMFAKMMAN